MKLGKLVVLYDSNEISLDGELNASFSENIEKRAEAANWHYLRVDDGNDLEAISNAIEAAKQNTAQPSLIEIRTIIGYGSPKEQGPIKHMGHPLGAEEGKGDKTSL